MATSKRQILIQMITIKKIKEEKQRLHVVGVVFLANCQSALVIPSSASANKTPCSETEDKKKMTE